MKNILFLSMVLFLFNCNKKDQTKAPTEIVSDSSFDSLSDTDKLQYLFDKNFYDFKLSDFVIKKINDKENSDKKIDFKTDKVNFTARIRFDNKTHFYTVAHDEIIFSDTKKEGYISTNNSTYFIVGYYLKGKFYFTENKRLG